MSTGSALRERADSWLEATTPFPPPARSRDGNAADPVPAPRPSCHPIGPYAGASQRVLPPRSAAGARRLRGLLLLLLEPADLGQRLRARDVGDRPARPLLAVGAGGLPPTGRGDAVLLAQQREEDLRLLRAETGQLADPLAQRRAVRDVGPQVLRPAAVALDQQAAQLLRARGHRARVAVHRRRPLEDLPELLRVLLREGGGVEGFHAEPVGDQPRAGEGALHGELLVEQHAHE